MRIERHAVFHEPVAKSGGKARQRLLVLAKDGGRWLVELWSGPANGRLRREHSAAYTATREAITHFDSLAESIWSEGPVYPVSAEAERVLDTLAATGESATQDRPLPRAALPARASADVLTDWTRLAAAAARTNSAMAFLPDGSERLFCSIDETGEATLVWPSDDGRITAVAGRGELDAIDLLLPEAPWWGQEPAIPSTTFDGYAEDPGTAGDQVIFWVLDIVRYRGADVTAMPLAERLTLRDQALAELDAADRLPVRWRPVTHFTRAADRAQLAQPDVAAAAAPLPRLAVRDLSASYGARGALRSTIIMGARAY